MTESDIRKLLDEGEFPEETSQRDLIETHASWVILCDRFAYKIKKPIRYSFLDFSTLDLRQHFCQREVELNGRFTHDVYLGVVGVYRTADGFAMESPHGEPVDYAVKMRRMDEARQMDKLLAQGRVSGDDIDNLAEKIAAFHHRARRVTHKDFGTMSTDFNDLQSINDIVSDGLGSKYVEIIDEAVIYSNRFLEHHAALLKRRVDHTFVRDGHGDLHSRNIFLMPKPVPFDCVEFNDDLREIDVLNDIAFLCMDLDAYDRRDLSERFLRNYNRLFGALSTEAEHDLFAYYKMYRANIRAKVIGLKGGSMSGGPEKERTLKEVKKYLRLMRAYADKGPLHGS